MRFAHAEITLRTQAMLKFLSLLRACADTLFATVFFAAVTLGSAHSGSYPDSTTWRPLRVGAGGFLTGLDISPDSSVRVVRTDTYGAYTWDASHSIWVQLVTANSMPAADVRVDNNAGVYEIRIAPSLPTRLYMAYQGFVYRSDTGGSKWARTAFANVAMDPNDGYRTFGQKMAVDPVDPDVVYVGTPKNGLFVTTNGGLAWQPVSAVPASAPSSNGQHPGFAGIAFDPTSGRTGGRTNVIYVSSYGNGVFRSTDAGASWMHLDGGPSDVSHGKIASDGAYYVTGKGDSSVWRYSSGQWTDITPNKNVWNTVIIDPFDPARVVAVREGGYIDISHDRGATWSGIIWGGGGANIRVATDIPWLAWTNERYMSVGDMLFDPAKRDRIWFAEGIGVWYSDLPNTKATPNAVTFSSQSSGIEQLVANKVLAPPGGSPLLASWDRPVFYIDAPDSFPDKHGPDNQKSILMGWALDYASSDPTFIVGLFNWFGIEKSGYSRDSGRTWSSFAAYPSAVTNGKIGGGVAASTPSNIIWVPSNNSTPYYTKDGGRTWASVIIDGIPSTGETGWGWSHSVRRHVVAADRVTEGTFYIYNYLKGLYRSTDGGSNWTRLRSGQIAPFSGFNASLASVPGQAGHLFFTSGPQGKSGDPHPAANPFMRSTNGGATWAAVPDVLEVRVFGFGKPLTEYPTIFIVGWVKREYGIWRSDDNARSWIKIGDFPLGSLDQVTTIDGDKNIYGKVYVGFNGSGYAYGLSADAKGRTPVKR